MDDGFGKTMTQSFVASYIFDMRQNNACITGNEIKQEHRDFLKIKNQNVTLKCQWKFREYRFTVNSTSKAAFKFK